MAKTRDLLNYDWDTNMENSMVYEAKRLTGAVRDVQKTLRKKIAAHTKAIRRGTYGFTNPTPARKKKRTTGSESGNAVSGHIAGEVSEGNPPTATEKSST